MRNLRTSLAGIATASLALAALAACGTANDGKGDNSPIAVAATDSECDVERSEADAGNVTFEVKNDGEKVTEFYVYAEGDRIMGEVENIGPGLSRKLIVELPAGEYQTACKPGMRGKGIRGDFKVTGEAAKHASTDEKLDQATKDYQRYVKSQTVALIDRTEEFVDAVKDKDTEKAKALFPVARTYWERIEPVAEIFGDLDPAIDGRENDVEEGQEFTGYHRIEKALWQDNNLDGMDRIADKLLADVKEIVDRANKTELNPLQLANGSKELLDEVAAPDGKLSGEEDRYSHTDVWDMVANIEGSKAAINSLRPVLDERDPKLLKTLDEKFENVLGILAKHEKGDGYKLYTELTEDDKREIGAAVDSLSESVSKVAPVVAEKK